MKHTRIIVTHYGGPDALQVVEEECPEPKSGEVRVKMLAAGVGLPDVMAREGIHPETPPIPYTPGWDLVGMVDRLGEGVSDVELGEIVAAMPIHGAYAEYQHQDFVEEIRRLTGKGVDAVFDPIGGRHLWQSREALRPGGRVVGYGNTTSLRGKGLASARPGRRNRLHGIPIYVLYIAGGWLLPGRKRVIPYSIQWLKRLRPGLFRQDLMALLDLLKQQKIKPLIAQRFPLAEARGAQELLGKGGVTGKVVLVCTGSSYDSGAA